MDSLCVQLLEAGNPQLYCCEAVSVYMASQTTEHRMFAAGKAASHGIIVFRDSFGLVVVLS